MKKNLHSAISARSGKIILFSAMMAVSMAGFAGTIVHLTNAIMITKNLNSRKHKVKLFTASDSRTLLFTVDGVEGKHYTLFVFDLEGKLVTQSAILNRETSVLPEIGAGAYLYEVLAGDSKVETGQLKIK